MAGVHKFPKKTSKLIKIAGARKATRSMSRTDGTHLLDPTTKKKKIVARTIMDLGFVHPYLMGSDGHIYAKYRGNRLF